MAEALEDFFHSRPPTADKPLYGRTILAVEDSRYVSGILRLMCQRSGARLRRADTLRAAARHLRTYRPNIVIADLGLPDGSGIDLIRDLHTAEPRMNGIVALSGDDTLEQAALDAGADMFMAKPLSSVAKFQTDILSLLPLAEHPLGPRAVPSEPVVADVVALRDDLQHVETMLNATSEDHISDYCVRFLEGLAKSSDDTTLRDAISTLRLARASGTNLCPSVRNVTDLVKDRLRATQSLV